MIVSFVMTFLTTKDRPYLWVFYRFLDMAKQYNWPIIAQEEYFEKPSKLKQMGKRELLDVERVKKQFGYDVPSDEDLEKITPYIITDEFQKKLIQKYGSVNDAHLELMKNRDEDFEKLLICFFEEMSQKEQIESVITLTSFPSLYYVANMYGAKVWNLELGAMRSPIYLDTGYMDENVILGNNSLEQRYSNFCKEISDSKCPVFTHQELLAIMLQNKYLKYLFRVNDKPTHKLGLALGTATWLPFSKNSAMNDEELIYHAQKHYQLSEMLVRRHPGDFAGAMYPSVEYARDTSLNTLEFILKCKKVATLGSNLVIEAMLFNREVVVCQKSAGYYAATHNVEEDYKPSIELLNFIVFGYMVPFEFLTDVKYIRWRLSNPSESSIYKKHLEWYLSKKNISLDEVAIYSNKRLDKLLSLQNFDYTKKDDYSELVRPHIPTISDYKKKIGMLQNEIEKLKQEMENKS